MQYLAAITIGLLLSLAHAAELPQLDSTGIENAADHSTGRVSPGEIVILHPSNVGPAILAGAQIDGHGRVTTILAETRVLFDGIPAPMSFSVRGEVGAVVPYEVANRSSTDVVVEYQGLRSDPVKLNVVESAPALFTLDSTGKGQAGMLNATGCCNSPRNPAVRGSIVALYATGEGQTRPHGITGSVSAYSTIARYPAPQRTVRVLVGGKPAQIVYAGEAPHAVAGLLQVNFRVPWNAPLGDEVPLVLMIGNTRSPDAVTMAVRSPVERIAVIDPDPSTQGRIRNILRNAGYNVICFVGVTEALDQLGSSPVDLLMVSLDLSANDRNQAVSRLRADRPRLGVIASARSLEPDVLRSADLLGAQSIVTAPASPALVLKRVRTALRAQPMPYVADEERAAFYSIRGMPH